MSEEDEKFEDIDAQVVRDDWALALMEQGVIVRLSIMRWTAMTNLNYHELGIAFGDDQTQEFMSRYIKLGQEKLLPPKVSNEIIMAERRARNCLIEHSFDTIWGKFVPYSAFAEWKEANEETKLEFFEVAKSIGDRYDYIVEEVRRDYSIMGADVWRRIYPDSDGAPSESFLQNFTSKIIDKIPSRDEIIASFKYNVTFFKIPLPSFIQEDINKVEKLIQDGEITAREHILEIETKAIIANEYRDRKKELIDGFLESTVAHLRHHIAELANHTYDVLQRNEKDITMTHVKRIKRIIQKVKTLNFHNDSEITNILEDLDIEVSKFKGERDKKLISIKLRELVELSKKEVTPESYAPLIDYMDIR